MVKLYKILVVCTGNICRSPMAEGFLAHLAAKQGLEHVVVESAGTHAPEGSPASDFAVQALAEKGVDIQDHRASLIDGQAVRDADLILVMSTEHLSFILTYWQTEAQGKVRLIREFHKTQPMAGPVPDPIGSDQETYRLVADLLESCCEGVVASLRKNGS